MIKQIQKFSATIEWQTKEICISPKKRQQT